MKALSLLYFTIYSAIQPQVSNELSVKCNIYKEWTVSQ